MPEYTSTVTLIFGGNNLDAENVADYKLKLKDNFLGTFGILITDDEITDINKIRQINYKRKEWTGKEQSTLNPHYCRVGQ